MVSQGWLQKGTLLSSVFGTFCLGEGAGPLVDLLLGKSYNLLNWVGRPGGARWVAGGLLQKQGSSLTLYRCLHVFIVEPQARPPKAPAILCALLKVKR